MPMHHTTYREELLQTALVDIALATKTVTFYRKTRANTFATSLSNLGKTRVQLAICADQFKSALL